MSLGLLASAFVVGVLIHNIEEVAYLPRWSSRHNKWYQTVSGRHFHFAVGFLSLLLLVFAGGAYWQGPGSLWAYLFSGYAFAMVANVFVPHIVASISTRSYMPGTATAVLLNLPLGIWFLVLGIRTGFVRLSTLYWAAPLVAVGLAVSIPLLFRIAGCFLPNVSSE